MITLRIFVVIVAAVLLVFAHLGPAKWKPRTGLGGSIDHFLAYFAVALIVYLAWPRPLIVGVALMGVSALLEGLQRLTVDRTPSFLAAFCVTRQRLDTIDRHIAALRQLIYRQVELVEKSKLKSHDAERVQNLLATMKELMVNYQTLRRRISPLTE